MALSSKQRLFVEEYLACFNATQAAIRAGYSKRSAHSTGWETLRKPEVAELIRRRLQERAMSADEVLMRLAEQARGSLGDFLSRRDGHTLSVDLDQADLLDKLHLVKRLKQTTRTWTETVGGEDVEHRETRVEVELYSAQAALELLGKNHRLFADKLDVSHTLGVNFSVDEAAAAMSELDEWNRTYDVSESSG